MRILFAHRLSNLAVCAFIVRIIKQKYIYVSWSFGVHHIIYLTGMAAGYILNRFKLPPKVSPFINLILWAMSLCIMFLLVFGVWNGSLNQTWTAIYVSLGHTGRPTLAHKMNECMTVFERIVSKWKIVKLNFKLLFSATMHNMSNNDV